MLLNEWWTRELLGEVPKKRKTNLLHVKQTSLDKPVDAKWAADVWAAGRGSGAGDSDSVAREATSLDTPVDAKRAAGTRAAGRGT